MIAGIVSDTQNAFVPSRSISDNILIAHELLNHIRHKKHGIVGDMVIKVDMHKAYDRISWSNLKMVLIKLGFPDHRVKLIMSCVTTVSYEILVNETPLQQFKPLGGLRQGDPLSPYLFVLCMNVLSQNLVRAADNHTVSGIKICNGAPQLSHL